jgi:hypothetical protein
MSEFNLLTLATLTKLERKVGHIVWKIWLARAVRFYSLFQKTFFIIHHFSKFGPTLLYLFSEMPLFVFNSKAQMKTSL